MALPVYETAYQGASTKSRTFLGFKRVLQDSHHRYGYWAFNPEHEVGAWYQGFSSPEAILLSALKGDISLDDVELRWIPGDADTYNVVRCGNALHHIRSIVRERDILGLTGLSAMGIPVYPLDPESKLLARRRKLNGEQELTKPVTSPTEAGPSGTSDLRQTTASSFPVKDTTSSPSPMPTAAPTIGPNSGPEATPRKLPPTTKPGNPCLQCRRKKKRCDRQRPFCGLCARSGTVCDYGDVQEAGTRFDATSPARSLSSTQPTPDPGLHGSDLPLVGLTTSPEGRSSDGIIHKNVSGRDSPTVGNTGYAVGSSYETPNTLEALDQTLTILKSGPVGELSNLPRPVKPARPQSAPLPNTGIKPVAPSFSGLDPMSHAFTGVFSYPQIMETSGGPLMQRQTLDSTRPPSVDSPNVPHQSFYKYPSIPHSQLPADIPILLETDTASLADMSQTGRPLESSSASSPSAQQPHNQQTDVWRTHLDTHQLRTENEENGHASALIIPQQSDKDIAKSVDLRRGVSDNGSEGSLIRQSIKEPGLNSSQVKCPKTQSQSQGNTLQQGTKAIELGLRAITGCATEQRTVPINTTNYKHPETLSSPIPQNVVQPPVQPEIQDITLGHLKPPVSSVNQSLEDTQLYCDDVEPPTFPLSTTASPIPPSITDTQMSNNNIVGPSTATLLQSQEGNISETSDNEVDYYVDLYDISVPLREMNFDLKNTSFMAEVYCIDCGLAESCSPTCNIGIVIKRIEDVNILQLREIADQIKRCDPEQWRKHKGHPPTPELEDSDKMIKGMAQVLRNEESYKNDPTLHNLPDDAMVVLWGLKGLKNTKAEVVWLDGDTPYTIEDISETSG